VVKRYTLAADELQEIVKECLNSINRRTSFATEIKEEIFVKRCHSEVIFGHVRAWSSDFKRPVAPDGRERSHDCIIEVDIYIVAIDKAPHPPVTGFFVGNRHRSDVSEPGDAVLRDGYKLLNGVRLNAKDKI
jgi:hypothetical protein